VTLYHWDLPQALQDRGGWPARVTAQAFADYAEVMARALGDRVTHWMTVNEPEVATRLGYLTGVHAPGHRSLDEAIAASHHLLLAHGWATPVLRRDSPGSKVGIVLSYSPAVPASSSEADALAAAARDGQQHRWFLDPLSGRGYPKDVVAGYRLPFQFVHDRDLKDIAAPLDFLGVNYYFRSIVRSEEIPEARNRKREVLPQPETTTMGWEIYPEGLYDSLLRLKNDYTFPAYYVTEGGAAFADEVGPDGQVHDSQRIDYLQSQFEMASRAIAAGVPLKGYFVWSFMDNFEWARGFTQRFGLVYVDYATQARIPKASASWYGEFISE
jgi:beta-glucosidase